MNLDDFFEAARHPTVEKKPWMTDDIVMELVTADTITRVVDECIAAGLYAADLETTGLDNRVRAITADGFKLTGGPRRTIDQIVGACLSPDGVRGYYLPVRHVDGAEHNIPVRLFESEMRRLFASDAVSIWHNGKFDHEFLEFCGSADGPIAIFDDHKRWEDTLLLAYLFNSRQPRVGLKAQTKKVLEWEMIELTDLFTDEQIAQYGHNFAYLDPGWEPAVWYGASDAICTYRLYQYYYDRVVKPETGTTQKAVYVIEKRCIPATRWMERNCVHVNKDKVLELIRVGQREFFESMRDVYNAAAEQLGRDVAPGWFRIMDGRVEGRRGYDPDDVDLFAMDTVRDARKDADKMRLDPMGVDGKIQTNPKRVPSLTNPKEKVTREFPVVYDILAPAQLGLMFWELGIKGLVATEKSGQVKTSKDVLDDVIEKAGERYPFMRKVKWFRENLKALGNLVPIYEDSDEFGLLRINFKGNGTDTGRFTTPAEKGKNLNGGTRWNLHSIPAGYDPNRPEAMRRIRECVSARDNKILAAIDYAGVELRVVTNLSREPKWLPEYSRCSTCDTRFESAQVAPDFCPNCGSDKIGDLHTLTAIAIYGESKLGTKEFKQLRQNAKALNFAMCYGGGGSAAQRAVGGTKEEGQRIKRQFDATYKGLLAWWQRQHAGARRKDYEYVVTAFQRRYPVPDINLPKRDPETGRHNGFFISKAQRNAVNGPVQGTSADITKYAMALIYQECRDRGWLEKVLMTITIHDELVFEIDPDILEEALVVIQKLMAERTVSGLRWPIPLKVDIELGHDWTVPWNYKEMLYGKKPWAPEIAHLFTTKEASAAPAAQTPATPPAEAATAPASGVKTLDVDAVEVPSNGGGKPHFEVPVLTAGQPYTYKISARAMNMVGANNLAHIILQCRDKGTHPLRVMAPDGTVVWDSPRVLVNPAQFATLAKHYGI